MSETKDPPSPVCERLWLSALIGTVGNPSQLSADFFHRKARTPTPALTQAHAQPQPPSSLPVSGLGDGMVTQHSSG